MRCQNGQNRKTRISEAQSYSKDSRWDVVVVVVWASIVCLTGQLKQIFVVRLRESTRFAMHNNAALEKSAKIHRASQ